MKCTKNRAITLATAASLGLSLGVCAGTALPEQRDQPGTTATNKVSRQIKMSTQGKTSSQTKLSNQIKVSDQHKISAQGKVISNQEKLSNQLKLDSLNK